jgi:hypothetical protein
MGCQYMNPHNSSILKVFNFNTNIQIGDASQVFYSTLYMSKSTQEDDSEKQQWIDRALVKRIRDYLMKIVLRQFNQTTSITKN